MQRYISFPHLSDPDVTCQILTVGPCQASPSEHLRKRRKKVLAPNCVDSLVSRAWLLERTRWLSRKNETACWQFRSKPCEGHWASGLQVSPLLQRPHDHKFGHRRPVELAGLVTSHC